MLTYGQTESTLYWLFDHEIDYLTLSDSDVTIRPFAGKKDAATKFLVYSY